MTDPATMIQFGGLLLTLSQSLKNKMTKTNFNVNDSFNVKTLSYQLLVSIIGIIGLIVYSVGLRTGPDGKTIGDKGLGGMGWFSFSSLLLIDIIKLGIVIFNIMIFASGGRNYLEPLVSSRGYINAIIAFQVLSFISLTSSGAFNNMNGKMDSGYFIALFILSFIISVLGLMSSDESSILSFTGGGIKEGKILPIFILITILFGFIALAKRDLIKKSGSKPVIIAEKQKLMSEIDFLKIKLAQYQSQNIYSGFEADSKEQAELTKNIEDTKKVLKEKEDALQKIIEAEKAEDKKEIDDIFQSKLTELQNTREQKDNLQKTTGDKTLRDKTLPKEIADIDAAIAKLKKDHADNLPNETFISYFF